MELNAKYKDKIAIVAVGYNRINSMKRLLSSLQKARYPQNDIPLFISIDCSGDEGLYEYVENFQWEHGPKYVNIQKERLGLKNHILQCGDLTKYFRAVIILEDDIFVSEYFYDYVVNAVDYYYEDSRIGGISLYQNEVRNCSGGTVPVAFLKDGSDVYLKQSPASWGECWTDKQWPLFREWYSKFEDSMFSDIDMPEGIKSWGRAWSKYYMAYLIQTDRYFVFPQISHTTCFGDAGEHSSASTSIGQANLLCGSRDYIFRPFEKLTKYSIFQVNKDLYSWISIPEEDLCVDWYCESKNIRKCRYILTPAKLPFKVVRSFGLVMLPIELNIKYTIEGNDLFIYDTINGEGNALGREYQRSMAYYYLRHFSVHLAVKYVMDHYINAIKRRLHIK